YYDANEAALAKYRSYAQSIDCDFETKDSYVYEVGSSEKLDQELSALKRLRIPAEPVGASSLPVIAAGAIRFRDQAQFHPLKFGFGIAQGLRIYENTRALEFAPHTVTTNHGKITANRIIIATHFPILNKHGGYFLKMYQQRSYVLALKNAPMVDGMYRDEAKDGLSLRSYGDLLLLGGGSHRTGKKSRGWEDLETYARIHYPQAKIRCRWATQDCITLDGIPYIGQYGKGTPDVFVATGFNKWGMTSSMVSAMILTDLLQGRENPYAQVFSLPVVFTKQSGGSKEGTWGSTIGLIIGFFIGPIGIILGPFCGAYIGELIHDSSDNSRAIKAAFGSFKGFILGTGLKMIACAIFLWIYIISLF
ncbi:MAG: FAD-dependent oxidoreductase, partial [Treponema sp.]|nr:FAD-dependent oxidoreductase [Treponema sp.]